MGRFQAISLHDDDKEDDENNTEDDQEEISSQSLCELVNDIHIIPVGHICSRDTTKESSLAPSRERDTDRFYDSFVASSANDDMLYPHGKPVSAEKSYKVLYFSVIVAVVALLWKDPPPAPPSTQMSWDEYLFEHSKQFIVATSTLVVHVPVHLMSWLMLCAKADFQLFVERLRKPACVAQGIDIVGQDLAAEWMNDSLLATTQERQRPLVVLATGMHSTGKRTLGVQLAGCHDALNLKLKTNDFYEVANTIASHVDRVGPGAIIMIENIEDMESELLSSFLLSIDEKETGLEGLWFSCRHSIIYMTSRSIGATHIARNMRISGGNLFRAKSLPADLRDAVEDHQLRVDLILPFCPFTFDSLAVLLKKRLERFISKQEISTNVYVTDAAVAAILHDQRVEYIEWHMRHQEEGHIDHVMAVAVDGASVLNNEGPIMSKLYGQLNQLHRHPEKEALLLDFDSSLYRKEEGLLKWCTNEAQTNCEVARRFRI